MVLITVLTLPIHILQTASLIMKKQKKNTKTPRPSVMQPDTPSGVNNSLIFNQIPFDLYLRLKHVLTIEHLDCD